MCVLYFPFTGEERGSERLITFPGSYRASKWQKQDSNPSLFSDLLTPLFLLFSLQVSHYGGLKYAHNSLMPLPSKGGANSLHGIRQKCLHGFQDTSKALQLPSCFFSWLSHSGGSQPPSGRTLC